MVETFNKSPSRTSSTTASSPTLAHSSPPLQPSSTLQSTVEEWSRATGLKTDVVLCVQNQVFHLHKDPLTSRSRNVRRLLVDSSSVTVSLPSNITAETFTAVVCFCYTSDISITPFNVAALRIAAEWLEMEEDGSGDGEENLLERTDWYFCQAVTASPEYAVLVLKTCLELLHGGEETAAFLAGRCVEAIAGKDGGNTSWLNEVASIAAEEFHAIAATMRPRFADNHDFLYGIVDHYFEKKKGELREEEKNRICCAAVDCRKLSRRRLIELVQNPRMPVRFVVQAMLAEQFHTRNSVLSRVDADGGGGASSYTSSSSAKLGDFLEQDTAIQQARHLRATMASANFRIQRLEEELEDMRKQLRERKGEAVAVEQLPVVARSASFRFSREGEGEENLKRSGRGLGRMLIYGLKSIFGARARASLENKGMR